MFHWIRSGDVAIFNTMWLLKYLSKLFLAFLNAKDYNTTNFPNTFNQIKDEHSKVDFHGQPM